ncbi:MAG: hypothetical protein K0B05_04390 [Bacteroidales bacterium]|nr:hypothetical protein [Bacteroidales bacterium]
MQKRPYVHFLLSSILLSVVCTASFAQGNEPTAVGTEKGIWVYLGNEIPTGFQYQILKKEGSGNFSPMGTSVYREDAGVLKTKTEEYFPLFDNLDKPGDDELSFIRQYAVRNKTTDSVYIPNFPVMHLLFGTAFLDLEVSGGKTYQYRVIKMTGNTRVWERTSNTVHYPSETNIPKPQFKNNEEFDTHIILRWFVAGQGSLNSFLIYRRVFGKGEYHRINATRGFSMSQDTVFLIAADTSVQNPALYEYFIKPLDIYGNSGPESEVISAGTIGNASFPVLEFFKAGGGEKDHQVELSWKFNEADYLRSIEVFRSNSFDSGYVRIARLSPKDTSFTDIVPVANENYWYYLVINGPTGSSLPSAKVPAMFRNIGERPLPPSETGAESIRGGIRIYWSYYEPFAKGFYVYRYLYDNAEFEQVSGLIPAIAEIYSFTDTSKYLQGNEVYRYAVRAVNDVDQLSDFSETASASPGKKATVSSPMNLRISRTDNGIILVWDDMRETEPVLLGYKVFRREEGDTGYSLMPHDTLRSDRNYYRDSTLVAGKTYTFIVSAIDFYGNESERSVPLSYTSDEEYFMPPEILRAVNTAEGILISWGQITDENIVSVKIYRSQTGGQPSVIATLQKDSEEFLDKSVSSGELYIYEISMSDEGNMEYGKSRGVSIRR